MTVAGEQGWAITDPVLHLRMRGSRAPWDTYELPAYANEVTIGSGDDRTIRLIDPSNQISRHHVVLTRQGSTWTVRDDGSKNGIRLDGEPRLTFDLAPGVEIRVGSFVLVAESARLIALRDLLDRWIGWRPERYAEIDRALRALRFVATLRAALVIRGEGDLTFLARRLHLQTLGEDQPFVVAEAGRDGLASLHAAAEGTLCIDAARLPSRWSEVLQGLRDESFKARTIVCASTASSADATIVQLAGPLIIDIAPLSLRGDELDRVLREYAAEGATDLHASVERIRPIDWERLLAWRWSGLADLANDAYRLVALRQWGVTDGAERLGLTHGALSRWALRRKLATF